MIEAPPRTGWKNLYASASFKEAVLDGQVSIHAGQVSQCDLLRPAEEL